MLVFAMTAHEYAHAATALRQGDDTAYLLGRVTLNPIKHVDPMGTILFPGALALLGGPIFGWAKPVPVVSQRLRNPRYGMMAVAAAGPGMNLLLALVGSLLVGAIAGISAVQGAALPEWVMTMFGAFIVINAFLALFNLLPIPPFDGSHILGGLLPERWAPQWRKIQSFGMVLIIALVAATWAFPSSGLVANVVMPPVEWISGIFYGVANSIAHAIAV